MELEICFNRAKELGKNYVGIRIQMEGFLLDEIIINGSLNFDGKLEYYKQTYDADLNHKYAKGISIVGFVFGNTFSEIETELLA